MNWYDRVHHSDMHGTRARNSNLIQCSSSCSSKLLTTFISVAIYRSYLNHFYGRVTWQIFKLSLSASSQIKEILSAHAQQFQCSHKQQPLALSTTTELITSVHVLKVWVLLKKSSLFSMKSNAITIHIQTEVQQSKEVWKWSTIEAQPCVNASIASPGFFSSFEERGFDKLLVIATYTLPFNKSTREYWWEWWISQ